MPPLLRVLQGPSLQCSWQTSTEVLLNAQAELCLQAWIHPLARGVPS